VTEEERAAAAALHRKREELKKEYYEKQSRIGARKSLEDRVMAAVQSRCRVWGLGFGVWGLVMAAVQSRCRLI
jgi:hypothetical protein